MTNDKYHDMLQPSAKLLKLTTLNVNGIHNITKRLDTFEILKNRTSDIVLLQETHSTPGSDKEWEKKWQGKSIWHSRPTLKGSGVAILFKENLHVNTISSSTDKNDRVLKCLIQTNKKILQIINVYFPTIPSIRKKFYSKFSNFIDEKSNFSRRL